MEKSATDQYRAYYPEKSFKYPELTREVTFLVTERCNLQCFVSGTKILMSDFTQKDILDIQIGDKVLGFSLNGHNKQIKPSVTTVTKLFKNYGSVREIVAENGQSVICTDEHPFLSDRKTWRLAKNLNKTTVETFPVLNIEDINIYDINYIYGYLLSTWLGDGMLNDYKHGVKRENPRKQYTNRLAVLDYEIINRIQEYLNILGIPYQMKPFNINKEDYVDALFVTGKEPTEKLDYIIDNNFRLNKNKEYYRGFLAGIIDAEGNVENIVRIFNCNQDIISETKDALDSFGLEYNVSDGHKTINYDKCYCINVIGSSRRKLSIFQFLLNVRSAIYRKSVEPFLNKLTFNRTRIISNTELNKQEVVYNFETENHTYIANNFLVHNCTYCYQINKTPKVMPWETAKKIVDGLFKMYDDDVEGAFITGHTEMIVLDFIGGEPMLEIDLIRKICDYFWSTAIKRHHIWAETFMVSFASNGTVYFTDGVQDFFKKYRNHLSYSVSIDGTKEMHDACRVFPDGSGSFDLAKAALDDYDERFHHSIGTKATIALENLPYLSTLIKYYVGQGFEDINANCVYEAYWNLDNAKMFYNELKDTADFLLGLDHEVELALFNEQFFHAKKEDDVQNWCFGKGTPVLTSNGYKPIEELKIGDLVYTQQGNIKPITNIMTHVANNCVQLKSSGAFPIVCTNDHKFYSMPYDYRGWLGKIHYKPYGKYEIGSLKKNDLIQVNQLPKRDIENNLAYLLGRYLGDGWVTNSDVPAICCGKDELDELKTVFDSTGIKYSITESRTTYDFYATKELNKDSDIYIKFVDLVLDCGKGALNKKLPGQCLAWNDSSLYALIDGYVSADGYYKKNGYISTKTVSRELADDIMLVLRTLGLNPTCSINHSNGKELIEGREVNSHDRYEIYWNVNKTRYYKDVDGMKFTSRITTVPVEDQLVYNITVEDDHSYFAGSYVVSNCGGTGAMLAYDPDGTAYPCVRYMPTSLGTEMKPIVIGDVESIYTSDEAKKTLEFLDGVDRRTLSTDECFYCPIAEGCSWCFPAGTKVRTPEGYINIEDIKQDDIVFDMNREPLTVIRTTSHIADNLVGVRAAGFKDTITTSNHPFWCKPIIGKKKGLYTYGDPKWVQASELKVGDRIALTVPKFGYEDFDVNLAYILGRYIGDGWKTTSRKQNNTYKYYICCSFVEQDELEQKLKLANISYNKHIGRTVAEYNIHISNGGGKILMDLFNNCGINARDKRVPQQVFNWRIDSIKSLLNGYFDADGSRDNKYLRFSTVSYDLFLDISELIRGSYHKNVSITERRVNKIGTIEGRLVNQSDSYEGRFILEEESKKFYEYDGELMWVNIKPSKLNLPNLIEVFNIEVENNPSYIAEGALVHNCSAWNFQYTGSVDRRCTNICIMHKARSLANVYYWNKKYLRDGIKKYNHRFLPDDQSLEILGQEEFDSLNALEQLAKDNSGLTNPANNIPYELDYNMFMEKYNNSIGQNAERDLEYRSHEHKKNTSTGMSVIDEKYNHEEEFRK